MKKKVAEEIVLDIVTIEGEGARRWRVHAMGWLGDTQVCTLRDAITGDGNHYLYSCCDLIPVTEYTEDQFDLRLSIQNGKLVVSTEESADHIG
jgi:hypothetical protein